METVQRRGEGAAGLVAKLRRHAEGRLTKFRRAPSGGGGAVTFAKESRLLIFLMFLF